MQKRDLAAAQRKKRERMDKGSYTGDFRDSAVPMRLCGCPDCVRKDPARARLAAMRLQDYQAVRRDLKRLRGNW